MSLQDLVNVSISSATVTPTRPGFGTPLIAAYHTKNTDLVRFYTDIDGVAGDGFTSNEPAYKAAQVAFAQDPAPARIAIGRLQHKHTQAVDLKLTSASALDRYTLKMVGSDGVSHTMDFASTGVVATDAASLVTAINAATMTAVTSAGTAPPVVTLTGTPASAVSVIIAITTGGARGTAVFKWSSDGGATYTSTVTTGATNVLGATGLTANFATGTNYSTDNVYTAKSAMGFASRSTATVTVTQYPGDLGDFQNWNPLGKTTPFIELTDQTPDHSLSNDLDDIKAAAPAGSWYDLALDSNSAAEVTAAGAWTEAAGSFIFGWNNSDTVCITTATTDVFSTEKALSHARGYGLYSGGKLLSYGGLGWASKTLPQNPGSLTFMYKTIASVPVDVLSTTAQTNLDAKHANYYIEVAGINTTINGWDSAGEYIDIVWGTDALKSQIQIDVFAQLAKMPKVPYTDLGVDTLKSIVLADLDLFATPQYSFIAPTPKPSVDAPTVASISSATRATRVFPGITFSGQLAGAIHKLTIKGVLQP